MTSQIALLPPSQQIITRKVNALRAAQPARESVSGNGAGGYVPQAPSPAQAAFLALDAREALYGGAAGGGK